RLDASDRPLDELRALAPLISAAPQPLILTCRSLAGGGLFGGEREARLEVLRHGSRLAREHAGGCYVDLEEDDPLPALGRDTRVIRSLHDFSGVPGDLEQRARRMARRGADVIKVACLARDLGEALQVASLPRRLDVPCVAIPLGDAGSFARILGGAFGMPMVYGTGGSAPAAPGQIPVRDLVHVYRAHELRPGTPLFALIGHPVGHSLSPFIHNHALQQMGMSGTYVAIDCERFANIDQLAAIPIDGFSVTLPHKQHALAWASAREPTAERLRAANTLYRQDGRMVAANTDYDGFLEALAEAHVELRGKRALVIGAGGAARAVVFALKDQGARVSLFNRTPARGEALARECQVDHVTGSVITERADLIVQCSACGMAPASEASPVPAALFGPGQIAFDLVYNPLETRFLREARQRGANCIPGLNMLAYQARGQLLRWVGHAPSKEVLRGLAEAAAAARGAARRSAEQGDDANRAS
ncbi:MAG: shikimate dehydrogenase, partial [Planctomycetota bacterium]